MLDLFFVHSTGRRFRICINMNAYGVLLTCVLTDSPPIQFTINLLLRRFVPNRSMIHKSYMEAYTQVLCGCF